MQLGLKITDVVRHAVSTQTDIRLSYAVVDAIGPAVYFRVCDLDNSTADEVSAGLTEEVHLINAALKIKVGTVNGNSS